MKPTNRLATGLCFLLVLTLLMPACRKAQAPQPAGPIVQTPPWRIFGGEPTPQEPSGLPSGSHHTGSTHLSKKVTPEEIERAEKQLLLHPNDPKTQNDAGATFAASGDIQRGTDLLAEARANAPKDPTIAYNYAQALYQQGKTDEAMTQAEASLQLQPEFDEARLLEAGVAIQKG